MIEPRRAIAPRAATTMLICDAVAAHYGITRAEILSPSHEFRLAHPRQVAMYFAHRVAQRSPALVGRMMGRHHSTVLHASNRVSQRLHYRRLAEDMAAIGADIARRVAHAA